MWGCLLLIALFTSCTTTAPPPPRPTPVPVPPQPVSSVTDEPEPRAFDDTRDAPTYLANDAPKPTRFARVSHVEALYAKEPAEDVAPLVKAERQEASPDHVVAVVEERPTSLRVVFEEAGVRLVVYLREDDIHRVVRRRARAALGARNEPFDGGKDGVWLRPGAIGSGQGVLRSVVLDDAMFKGNGWVGRKAIDRLYEPEPAPDFNATAYLAQGTPIRTQGGTVLHTSPADTSMLVAELETQGQRTRIRYVSEMLLIEGWVPTSGLDHDDVEAIDTMSFEGVGGWGTSGNTRYLHAGDKLFAHGEVIGIVTGERVRVISGLNDQAGMQVEVYVGRWPFVPLWVFDEDIAFGDLYEKAFLGRARIEALPKGAELPWAVNYRQGDVAECWTAALAGGATQAIDLRLEWKTGKQIPVPAAAKLDPTLRACLEKAFDMSFVSSPPPLPVAFTLHLEPTPLPTR